MNAKQKRIMTEALSDLKGKRFILSEDCFSVVQEHKMCWFRKLFKKFREKKYFFNSQEQLGKIGAFFH